MKDIENEIAPHRRKKGRKNFLLECRLTPKGFERKMKEYRKRLEKEMQWSDGYSRYEKLKDAEHALKDISKRKSSNSFWGEYYGDREYRIVEKIGKSAILK